MTRVTTIHRDLGLSPRTSASVGRSWPWILDSMKSLLETGAPLEGRQPGPTTPAATGDDAEGALHRRLAVDANNATWELLERWAELTPDQADDLLGRAYAAAHHWRRATGAEAANAVRATWLVSRAHAVLGQGDLARHHAERCLDLATAAGLGDFDLAYAYEARASALACLATSTRPPSPWLRPTPSRSPTPRTRHPRRRPRRRPLVRAGPAPDLTHPSVGASECFVRGPPARNTPMGTVTP